MHVDDLRTVGLIADLGSFARAGEYLNMSQSAVSQRVRHLERELGVKLFMRSGRRAVLSRQGEAVHRFARELDGRLLALRHELSASDARSDVLVIGSAPPGARNIIPLLIRELYQVNSRARVRLVTIELPELVSRLLHGDIDLGVLPESWTKQDLESEPLWIQDYVLLVPPGHPLTQVPSPTAREIASYPFVNYETSTYGTSHQSVTEAWAATHSVALQFVLDVDSQTAVAGAVAVGIGLAFVTRLTGMQLVREGVGVIIEAPGPVLRQRHLLAYRPDHPRTGSFEDFIRVLRGRPWRAMVFDAEVLGQYFP